MKRAAKTKEIKPRDMWIYNSWKMTGCGFHKNKKKMIARKAKYKGKDPE